MAFSVAGLSDFTEKAKQILTEGLLYNDSYANFSFQDGIKVTEYLNYLDSTVEIQAGVCDLSVSGSTTMTEKTITVYPMSIFQKWCLSDLDKKDIKGEAMGSTGKGQWNQDLKTTLVTNLVANSKKQLDKMIFQGATASGDLFNGLTTKFTADSDVIDVTSTSAATIDNIDNYVADMIDAVPQDMWSRGLMTIHMPLAYFKLYKQNRINANMYHDDPKYLGLQMMDVFGWEGLVNLKAEPGLLASTQMFLTYDKNIVMLYDGIHEVNRAEMFFNQLDRNVYYSASWKIGVDYYFGSEVVLFTKI